MSEDKVDLPIGASPPECWSCHRLAKLKSSTPIDAVFNGRVVERRYAYHCPDCKVDVFLHFTRRDLTLLARYRTMTECYHGEIERMAQKLRRKHGYTATAINIALDKLGATTPKERADALYKILTNLEEIKRIEAFATKRDPNDARPTEDRQRSTQRTLGDG